MTSFFVCDVQIDLFLLQERFNPSGEEIRNGVRKSRFPQVAVDVPCGRSGGWPVRREGGLLIPTQPRSNWNPPLLTNTAEQQPGRM